MLKRLVMYFYQRQLAMLSLTLVATPPFVDRSGCRHLLTLSVMRTQSASNIYQNVTNLDLVMDLFMKVLTVLKFQCL